ncbi:protein-lysine N-methyltransferase EEF2KMT isoform X3 [Puma concolor]|uniref:Protein-lysine N-methyltransferase EEF2KMT isoform X3 n=1 Tax=Puma concolor TaxID=9696 RepID=A0A6P6HAU4_PUMCO|nr:protein-lysine N-methyltransferase EEF2KMT isoform X3 [Puma concolor]
MAPEESTEAARLSSFERRFLAARALRSFPWQSLEEKLRDSSGPELLLDILQKPSGDSVTLSESTAIISHGTTGLVTWDAALYLAEWAMQNPAAFAHRTVLELGSGAGLTGLTICKTCHPSAYIFSDCHSCVLEQLRGNILLNGLSLEADVTDPARHPEHNTCNSESPRVTVAQLDWDVVTAPQLAAFQPDVIIAADVLYCPETVLSLVRVLQRLSACLKNQQAPDAYIAFTVRNPETCQLFTSELGIAGIPWEAVPHHDQKLFPYEEHSEMAILKLTL